MNLMSAICRPLNDRPHDQGGSTRPLTGWLCPQDIAIDVDVRDRRRALETAAALVGRANGLDSAPILRALWRREQVGSTALGQGVAIPHARIPGIARPLTLFMRSRLAMEFDAPDGRLVSNFLFIMVPEGGDAEAHLQLLASVAEMFSDRVFRARLDAASTTTEVATVFADWADQRLA